MYLCYSRFPNPSIFFFEKDPFQAAKYKIRGNHHNDRKCFQCMVAVSESTAAHSPDTLEKFHPTVFLDHIGMIQQTVAIPVPLARQS